MKKLVVLVSFVVLVLAAGPAQAAGPPYTVSVGGSSAAGTHSFSAATTGTVRFSSKNNAGTILNQNCTSVNMAGSVTTGTALSQVGDVGSSTWIGCSIPGGAFAATQVGTWRWVGTGSNATSGQEIVQGRIEGLVVNWRTASNPNVCRYTMSGSARASFNESTQQLTVSETGYTGDLTLSNVFGCLGQWQNGNKVNLEMTFNVSSPDGAIDLS